MKVREKFRRYLFDNGAHIEFNNVTRIDVSENSHRLMCDEGYVIVTRSRVLAVIVPRKARKF